MCVAQNHIHIYIYIELIMKLPNFNNSAQSSDLKHQWRLYSHWPTFESFLGREKLFEEFHDGLPWLLVERVAELTRSFYGPRAVQAVLPGGRYQGDDHCKGHRLDVMTGSVVGYYGLYVFSGILYTLCV